MHKERINVLNYQTILFTQKLLLHRKTSSNTTINTFWCCLYLLPDLYHSGRNPFIPFSSFNKYKKLSKELEKLQ